MNRLIVMLLCVCSTIVCTFLAYLGFQAGFEAQAQQETPPEIQCNDLLQRVPADLYRLTLTGFRAGRHFVSYDDDEDGTWERVYMPFFPASLKALTSNYRAVIVCFADVPDQDELERRIRAGSLDADYWYYSQNLDRRTYNRMAGLYRSMDFDRSVILYAGFPRKQSLVGSVMLWVATIGAVFSIFGFGWQTIALMVAGFRSAIAGRAPPEPDDEEFITINRAGLPECDSEDEISERLLE